MSDENEILAEARARAEAAARVAAAKQKSWPLGLIGFGAAIGSAAVAGAVLYARRRDRS
ncbi:hypothetical protein [uncultured Sphingomonas sp.]|uniref:hypothetical protein n=1 Tax=uncultured Sphingomonas sp. TaxID=158754 RepID=UPI0035CB0857